MTSRTIGPAGRPPRRYALVDVNNFYASCESVFNPRLVGRPVVVLSNNDGCIVARSAEAKAMGIKMGQPWHQIRRTAEQQGVLAFSSNYALYQDMSNRVTAILRGMAPEIEVYSIDESFLDLTGMRQLVDHGQSIRARVRQWTGLTVCVGIGSTKTRAKLANHIAKKHPEYGGVFDLESLSAEDQQAWFRKLPVGEVWGVGRKHDARLQAMGIERVADMMAANPKVIRSAFSVVMEKTIAELNGVSCLSLELVAPDKAQIMSSRSFGRDVTALGDLREAVLTYTCRAAEKLRAQGSHAGSIYVAIRTNPFKPDQPQYSNGRQVRLPQATSDSRTLGRVALQVLSEIYQPGYRYKKAAVMLMDLASAGQCQGNLLTSDREDERSDALGKTLDAINRRFGRGAISLAGTGRTGSWGMKRMNLTPAYTSSWSSIPQANAERLSAPAPLERNSPSMPCPNDQGECSGRTI